jgi:hypothetical protein
LSHNGIEVIVAAVPPSGSIEARAAKLAESIAQKAKGKQVNIIACVSLLLHVYTQITNNTQTQHGTYNKQIKNADPNFENRGKETGFHLQLSILTSAEVLIRDI